MARPLKTYSHLADLPRKPSRYDVATTALHYRVSHPSFEVDVPIAAWYRQHQQGSLLQSAQWETFVDPRQTDYTAYVRLQQGQEAHVDGVLRSIEESNYDRDLPAAAHALTERLLTPLRYPFHGLQMVAAYVGQMAPASRITIAALLQAADESRRIQRVAYRMAQIRLVRPSFGDHSLQAWQEDPVWQPLRELVERLLVTFDWGEAFVALNVCVKPLLDDLFLAQLPLAARRREDYLLSQIFSSLSRDCDWHQQWTAALMAVALPATTTEEDRPDGDPRAGNRPAVENWVSVWWPRAVRAAEAFRAALGESGGGMIDASKGRALAFIDRLTLRRPS
ncbi:MAG: toluene monooxygenase system protein [Myxococcales bacterium]|jgi:toluene monooxygenase system protein E|nr:toluene monooxygenase system protein [Myxococcales bacterium]